jgi:hypothetical protein
MKVMWCTGVVRCCSSQEPRRQVVAAGAGTWVGGGYGRQRQRFKRRPAALPKGVKDHPLAMQINTIKIIIKGTNFAGSKERILPFLPQTNQEPLSGSRTATPLAGINPPGSNQNNNS